MRTKRIGVAGLLAILLALLASAAASGPAVGAGSGGVYIALGDSYTSAPLVPNQHGEPIDCGRSDHNYPSLIAAKLQPETFVDVSCGSAKTKHMTEPQTDLPAGGTNPPQFNALRADATLVTVGIGGNDAGLVSVATKCAQLGATSPNGTACRDFYAPGGNDTVQAEIDATKPKIDAVLQGIHERSPKARVAIVGYPNVLPLNGGSCYPTVPLSPDDVRYIDGLIVRINAMIAQRAARNEAEFIDTYSDSIGHDVCKQPPERWFEGLVPTEPAYPLHPNAKGEASMAGSAIDVLKGRAAGDVPVRLSGLGVFPRQVHGRKATVRFELNRAAQVRLVSRRRGPGRGRKRVARNVTKRAVRGLAGINAVELRGRRLGSRRPGRYVLIAKAVASDGDRSRPEKLRYRVVDKRR